MDLEQGVRRSKREQIIKAVWAIQMRHDRGLVKSHGDRHGDRGHGTQETKPVLSTVYFSRGGGLRIYTFTDSR